MAKDKLTDYDSTASGNLDVGGISVAEGMLPSGVNNAIRELMSHQADAFGAGTPLYVDQTNNRLGVGNAAPATALDVTGTVTADGLTVDGDAVFSNGDASVVNGDDFAKIKFNSSDGSSNSSGTLSEIANVATNTFDGSATRHKLVVRTNDGFAATGTNKDRISVDYSGDISFYEDTGTTAKFFWDASEERLGLGTTSPLKSLHVVDDAADPLVVNRSQTGNTAIQVTDGTDTVYFGMPTGGGFAVDDDANLAEAPWLKIDSSGTVTKPYQPSFMVTKSGGGDQTLVVNSVETITWSTESWDVGGNFASNIFTAPVTGKYYLQTLMRIDQFDTAANYYILYLTTSNRSKQVIIEPNFTSDLAYYSMSVGSVFDMDAGDIAYVRVQQNGGTASHIDDSSSYTSFSGYLLG